MKFLIFLLFGFLSLNSVGQNRVELNRNCLHAYQEILSLKFDKARQLLAIENARHPQNVYVDYLENYIDFLGVFISEEADIFDSVEEKKDKRINRIKKLDEASPYRDYLLGNINLQWAVARMKFGEYFTAAFEINRAYRLLKANKENFPEFVPNNITLGILHIMIGLVPDQYQWLLEIINMEGSVETGKDELRFALEQTMNDERYAYLKNEVLFYLGFVELNIYPDEAELDYLLAQLEAADKNNLLLSYLAINILMRTGNNDKVLRKFAQLPRQPAYLPFYYLNYLEAECHLRKLDLDKAEDQYTFFLEKFNGQNYLKDACRKLAWIKLITGNEAGYVEWMLNAATIGAENVGQDADAQREAEMGQIPKIELIKARLLFDGGYYQQADSVLITTDTSGLLPVEFIELNYRKARIAHQLNKTETAKLFYAKTIDLGKTSPRYFAGNSALKLGEIYESEKNYNLAEGNYRLCLRLNFDEYEAGIHSKAKAALKRISD